MRRSGTREAALQIESAAAADVLAVSTNQLCSSSSSEPLPPRADAALRLLRKSSRSFPPPPPPPSPRRGRLCFRSSCRPLLFKYSSPPLDRLFVARTRFGNRHYLCLSACLPRPLVPPDFIWVSLQVRLFSAALFKREKGKGGGASPILSATPATQVVLLSLWSVT